MDATSLEEMEVRERICRALKDYASSVRAVFGKSTFNASPSFPSLFAIAGFKISHPHVAYKS
jgi:hypothetical protein